ncbi:hypothetical protein LAZ67_X001911, partial [Cordylochernes scorpioides]
MVIGLKRAGWSIRQIAADTHLGASTVHRLWRRWLEQGNVAIYRNVGATRVTSVRVDRRILRQAVAAPQAICTAILQHVQDTLDHSISTRTISRRLVANGLHSCRPLRRLPLTPPNRRQRLEWCRARSTWMTEWHRVVFSDESRFCLSSDSRRVRVWRRRGERSNPAAIVERPTVRQRGIMVWGAIAYDSRSPLLRIQGTMTAQRYVDDVLRPVTLPYLQGVSNALYQQDNARPHTARISQQALQDVQMLPWPPYSPDLSPIEHVWDIIGRRLHALPQPRSEDELWQMVEREWRAIPQDAIRTLIDSLPRRVAACIAVRDASAVMAAKPLERDSQSIKNDLVYQRMPGHRKRRQFKQTDAFTRGMVIGPKRAGWSIRQIAADTHLGASTVHRLWRRWLEQGNVAIYRNAGAIRVTSARVDRRILRQAVAAPQATCTATLQHVQDTLDHSISTRTIFRRLVANGLHSCRPLRRLPLTPPNRRQRLEWYRARSTWMTEWHRVVFSDESRFCLSGDSRRVRVWRRRGERSNPAAIVERPTVRQRGIMVWGAIAYDSRSPSLRIQGTMTAQRYVDDVLRPVTLPYPKGVPNALYQQDNARPHTARKSQKALQDIQMLPWPPYSPDLSPIEHVWDIIGRRLHALPQPRSEDELEIRFVETHGRDSTGRYVVQLPFRNDCQLGDSKSNAIKRLCSLERSLIPRPEVYDQYRSFIKEYLELGHMSLVPKEDIIKGRYYLPHHPVIKEKGCTTKLRVVFDASAKTDSGLSLNDALIPGPKIQQDLFHIILRFRIHPVAINADIVKMYRQIRISQEDSEFQRIVWRNDPHDKIKDYRLETVTYGTSCAPFLATRIIKQLALDEQSKFPKASKIELTDFYVDDLVTGTFSVDEGKNLVQELYGLLSAGGFEFRRIVGRKGSRVYTVLIHGQVKSYHRDQIRKRWENGGDEDRQYGRQREETDIIVPEADMPNRGRSESPPIETARQQRDSGLVDQNDGGISGESSRSPDPEA